MASSLILGVGNTLLSDEGAGVHLVRHLRRQLEGRSDVTLLDGGTLGFTLAAAIAEHQALIVLDATQLNAAAGTVAVFEDEAMDRFLGTRKRSAHEVGLLDLMDMARLTDSLPRHRALVAIQPGSLDWGTQPTPAVRQAIPRAARQVMTLLQRWRVADQRACA